MSYPELVGRVIERIAEAVPEEAHVLVVNKGDESLLRVPGRRAGHFPQTPTGLYAGFYPADDQDAVDHLEHLRRRGAGYFVIPSSALWWLDHYPALREHLQTGCRLVLEDPEACLIYELSPEPVERTSPEELIDAQLRGWLDALLPEDEDVLVVRAGEDAALALASARARRMRYIALVGPGYEPWDRGACTGLHRELSRSCRLVARQPVAELFDAGEGHE